MKKIVLLTLLVLSLVFTGCSTTQLEFWAANKMTADWAASKMDMDMSFKMDMAGQSEVVGVKITGFTNTDDVSGYLQMSVNDSTGQVAMDAVDMYIKEGNVYMSTDYLRALATLQGKEFPKDFLEEGVEFVTFKEAKAQIIQGLVNNPNLTKEILSFYEEFAKTAGIDIPVEKLENTYTIKLNQQDFINLAKIVVFEGAKQLNTINEKFSLGLTKEEIVDFQEQVEVLKPEIETMCQLIGTMFSGELTLNITFEANKVIQDMKFQVTDPLFTGMTMTVEASSTVEKAEPQLINVPGKSQEISEVEYMEALMGTMIMIDPEMQNMLDAQFNEIPCKSFTKDEKTYVECRVVLEAFDKAVIYNTELQKVGIQEATTFKPINVITQEGTSFISLEELKTLGYSVEVNPYFIVIEE